MKIQIVAIYIVDVQTSIDVINLLSCMLNLTVYGIYPAINGKMQQLLALLCLFDLILYVPSTIFQLNSDGSSWIEPVLS